MLCSPLAVFIFFFFFFKNTWLKKALTKGSKQKGNVLSGSSPAQPTSAGKESNPGCPPAPPTPLGYQGCPGKGNPPGKGSFPEISLGRGVPDARAVDPASAEAGFQCAGGISRGGGGWLPLRRGCVPALAAVPAPGSKPGVSPWGRSDGGTDRQPSSWLGRGSPGCDADGCWWDSGWWQVPAPCLRSPGPAPPSSLCSRAGAG